MSICIFSVFMEILQKICSVWDIWLAADAFVYNFSENFEELSGKCTCYSLVLVKIVILQVGKDSCQLLMFSKGFTK